jgi:hypothetical protein
MKADDNRVAAFVKGFFVFLTAKQLRSAVLHGWQNEFSGKLSDVDFVIEPTGFKQLVQLLNAWCESQGWLLCQVLRHETTAAYCVCSAADNPACAVALDACTDYRRNESVLIPATDLLRGCLPIPSGGFRVSEAVELQYRFAKAAAKNKNAEAAAVEFANHTDAARTECRNWLREQWGIELTSWDAPSLVRTIHQLRSMTHKRPPLFDYASLRRVISRVFKPSGLLVITETLNSHSIATILESCFGRHHFRRCKKSRRWRISYSIDLISSTLIILPELNSNEAKFLPKSIILHLNPNQTPELQCQAIAKHLQQRCIRREGI